MAQEWYLMKSPYNQVSGFESEALNDFGEEGFIEALDSDIALDVELYNYDLSECTSIRAILNNRLTDTKLKTLVRHLLVPIGSCHAGMYAKVKGRFWLIVGIVDDNGIYEKAILSICNYRLTWLNDSGYVIQRWVNIISASQYNNGEHENLDFTIRSDQLLITLPDDDESLMVKQNDRFVIDRRCRIYEKEFDESVKIDVSKPVITYEVTRVDSILYDYQDSGLHQIMMTQDEQHENDGYYVVGGNGYWLCSAPKNREISRSSEILGESTVLYNGIEPIVFMAKFYDAMGKENTGTTPRWGIVGELSELLEIEYQDNSIQIFADDKRLIGHSYTLTLESDGYEPKSIPFTIESFM